MRSMMNPRMTLAFGVILAACNLAPAARADLYFEVPSYAGQPDTTSQEWDGFASATGGNAPNFGTSFNPNGTASLTNADPTAFLVGTDIYDFAAPLAIGVDVANYGHGAGWTTTVTLQYDALGNDFAPGTFTLSADGGAAVAYTSTRNVFTSPPLGGFGGVEMVNLYEWVLPGNASSYALSFTGTDPSIALRAVRVDTITSRAVPEPASMISASIGLLAFAGRRVLRRRPAIGVVA